MRGPCCDMWSHPSLCLYAVRMAVVSQPVHYSLDYLCPRCGSSKDPSQWSMIIENGKLLQFVTTCWRALSPYYISLGCSFHTIHVFALAFFSEVFPLIASTDITGSQLPYNFRSISDFWYQFSYCHCNPTSLWSLNWVDKSKIAAWHILENGV